VIHCPVTPFFPDGQVDYGTFEKVVNFHLAHGPSALGILLHIGESLNLSIEERKKLLELAVKVAGGRVPVIAHVSMPGTPQAVDLAQHAEKVGADAVCVITPYYWKPPEEAIFAHYVAVGTAVQIPLIAYNSPLLQEGVCLRPKLLVRLIERLPNFIGVKDAGNNFEDFIEARRATQAVKPDFALFIGVEYLLPTMIMGAVGSMSAISGVAPKLVQDLYGACAQGQYDRARELQDKASHLWQLFKIEYPAPIKAGMEIMGRPVGPTRLPIRPLTEEGKQRLREELQKLGILSQEPHGW
jgi:4-hydroxy-tetrahydrodipicolinate synthase